MKRNRENAFLRIGTALLVVMLLVTLVPMNSYGKTKEKYRNIKILEITGEVCIERGEELIPAYEQMALQDGDRLVTDDGSMAGLQLDDDKYLLVEENTDITIEAVGSPKKGYIRINMVNGAVYNEIRNPLSAEDSYEVKTPEGVMAVRGTRFRAASYGGKSVVTAFEGVVGLQHTLGENTQVDGDAEVGASGEVLLTPGAEAVLTENTGSAPNTMELREADADDLPSYFQENRVPFTAQSENTDMFETPRQEQRRVSHLQEVAARVIREALERASYREPEVTQESASAPAQNPSASASQNPSASASTPPDPNPSTSTP